MLNAKPAKNHINSIINFLFIYLALSVALSTIIIVMEIHTLIILYIKISNSKYSMYYGNFASYSNTFAYMIFISMLAWIEYIYMAFNTNNIYLNLESKNMVM